MQMNFFDAWVYTPYLITAIIYSSLSGCIGGILAAKKKTKIYAASTFVGAIINIILNVILVKSIGVIGAAVATLISCVFVYTIRIIYLMINNYTLNSLLQYVIVLPLTVLMFAARFEWSILIQVFLLIINLVFNGGIIIQIVRKRKHG